MHIVIRRALETALMTGGLIIAGAAAAQADEVSTSIAGDGPIVVAPVQAPVTIGDVAVGVLGDATTESAPTSPPTTSSEITSTDTTTDPTSPAVVGVLDSATIAAPIQAPVTIGSVAAGVLGDATSTGGPSDGSTTTATIDNAQHAAGGGDAPALAEVLDNTTIAAPIQAPITIGDVATGVLGDAAATGGFTTVDDDTGLTSGNQPAIGGVNHLPIAGILGDDTVVAPVRTPLFSGRIAVAALGDIATDGGAATAGEDEVANGGDGADGALTPDDAATAPGAVPAPVEGPGGAVPAASPAPGGIVVSSDASVRGQLGDGAPLGAAIVVAGADIAAGTSIAAGTDVAAGTDAAQLAATGFDPWRLAVVGVLLLLAGGAALLHHHVAAAP